MGKRIYELSEHATTMEEEVDECNAGCDCPVWEYEDLEDQLDMTDRKLNGAINNLERQIIRCRNEATDECQKLRAELKTQLKKNAALETKLEAITADLKQQKELMNGVVEVLTLIVGDRK